MTTSRVTDATVFDAYASLCTGLAERGLIRSADLVKGLLHYRQTPSQWGWSDSEAGQLIDGVTAAISRSVGGLSQAEQVTFEAISLAIERRFMLDYDIDPFGERPDETRWRIEVRPGGGDLLLDGDEMLWAIELIARATYKGDHFEGFIAETLSDYMERPYRQELDKKSNGHGPDGLFLAGGRDLGFPTEAFMVEAKAGERAIGSVTTSIRGLSALRGVPRHEHADRYREYCAEYVRRHYPSVRLPADYSMVFIGQSLALDRIESVPKDLEEYFDAGICFNAFGRPFNAFTLKERRFR